MTLKSYLWGMRVSTVFALAGWIFVINYIDPDGFGMFGRMLFYLSAFLSIAGIFCLFLIWIRKTSIEKGETTVEVNFRQGLLLAALVVILLFLQSMRILVWWDGLLVAAGIFLIELYFLSHKK